MADNAKNVPKGQHVIPRMHLHHFAGPRPSGQVWTYDKDTGSKRSAVPEETAVFKHFYSIERKDGSWDTSVEDTLAKNESKAAPIYEGLIAGKFPASDQDRADFAIFVALLYLRTRAQRQDVATVAGRLWQIFRFAHATHEGAFNTLMQRVEARMGSSIPPAVREELRRQLMDPSGGEVLVPKAQTMTGLEASKELAPLLAQMNWSIVRPKRGFLITSDNPVVRRVDPSTVDPLLGSGGFMNKSAEVSLALTPEVGLVMTRGAHIPRRATLRQEGVDIWNKLRAHRAEQFLYAHMEDPALQRLATQFKGSRPKVRSQGFGPEKFAEAVVPRRWKDNGEPPRKS